MSISFFIQNTLLKRISFVTHSKIYNITYCNASTFYAILRDKKYEKPYTEKMWERILNLQFNRSDWSKIYLHNLDLLNTKNCLNSDLKLYIIYSLVGSMFLRGIKISLQIASFVNNQKTYNICCSIVTEYKTYGKR